MNRRTFFQSITALFAFFFLPAPSVSSYAEVAKTFVWTTQYRVFSEVGPAWLMIISGWMPDGIEYTAAEYVREEEDFNYARVALENAMERRYNFIVGKNDRT